MAPKRPAVSEKRKRQPLSIEDKREIIRKYDEGVRVADLALEYDRNSSTISTVLKDKERILGSTASKGVTILTRNRPPIMDDMEKLLLLWIREKQQAGDTISTAIICEKAKSLHADLMAQHPPGSQLESFRASHGWFDRFKARTGIHIVDRHIPTSSYQRAIQEWSALQASVNRLCKDQGAAQQQVREFENVVVKPWREVITRRQRLATLDRFLLETPGSTSEPQPSTSSSKH